MGSKVAAGLIVVLVVAVTVAASSSAAKVPASATPWKWTESYTEGVVVKKVLIPCKRVRAAADCQVAAAIQEVAALHRYIAACEALSDPARRLACLESFGGRDPDINLSHVRRGFPIQKADCVGAGQPDATGFRFSRFRCKITVVDTDRFKHVINVTGRIGVYVTGPATFRWLVI